MAATPLPASTAATSATHKTTNTHRVTAAHRTTTAHRTTSTHRSTRGTHASSTHKNARNRKHKPRGQLAIEPARVTEIQQALIREHYLKGEANGEWDAATIAAMQKYQADQGWQTKLTPDSRALKKLGLGPDYSKAINAKDSSFGEPPPASTIPPGQSEGFAAAAGINR
jgi:hypothetical protein